MSDLIMRLFTGIERRVERMGEGASGTITGDLRQDISDLREDIKSWKDEIKDELRYQRRAFWSLVASIVGIVVVIVQVAQ